jgi:mono/diheme cytochrome c family protein
MTRRLLLPTAIIATLGLIAAGCGSSGSSSSSSAPSQSTPPATQSTQTNTGGSSSGSGNATAGKAVFTTNCESCHTLKDAGSNGTIGPDLDSVQPSFAAVQTRVINGGGPMPAFGKQKILTTKQIDDVSKYVSSVAGQG